MAQDPGSRERESFSYAGTIFIGRIILDEATRKATAFSAADRFLGEFPNYDAARRAVSNAYRDAIERKASAAAALARLSEPVGFVSGLPADFLSRTR